MARKLNMDALKAQAQALGIEVPAKVKKAELEALIATATDGTAPTADEPETPATDSAQDETAGTATDSPATGDTQGTPETTVREALANFASQHELEAVDNPSRTSYYTANNRLVYQVMKAGEKSINVRFSVTDATAMTEYLVANGYTPNKAPNRCRITISKFEGFDKVLTKALELAQGREIKRSKKTPAEEAPKSETTPETDTTATQGEEA